MELQLPNSLSFKDIRSYVSGKCPCWLPPKGTVSREVIWLPTGPSSWKVASLGFGSLIRATKAAGCWAPHPVLKRSIPVTLAVKASQNLKANVSGSVSECDESNLITGIHFVSRWRLSMSSRPLRPWFGGACIARKMCAVRVPWSPWCTLTVSSSHWFGLCVVGYSMDWLHENSKGIRGPAKCPFNRFLEIQYVMICIWVCMFIDNHVWTCECRYV